MTLSATPYAILLRVIFCVDLPAPCVRCQVLEILSHVNKRVRGHASIKMPLDVLLALYAEPSSAPLVRNFALVYLEMAYARATEEARLAVVRSEQTGGCTASWNSLMLLYGVVASCQSVKELNISCRSSTAGQSPFLHSAAHDRGWHSLELARRVWRLVRPQTEAWELCN